MTLTSVLFRVLPWLIPQLGQAHPGRRRDQGRRERTGKKPGGKPPKAPEPGPRAKDQVSLTDAESRIMPAAGGGFEQAYNAQGGWIPRRT
jgi:hypothetical protein